MQRSLLRIVSNAVFVLLPIFASSQIIFQETFDEPTGSTTGSANAVNWTSSCPTCLAGDYFEVQGGVFEGNDTNGEAEWTTGNIDISSCNYVDISFDVQSVGTMEACGTGCNSADWVLFQYNVNGTGWVDPSNSYFCSGPCSGLNVVVDDDFSGTYSTGCLPVLGNTLQLRIAVQCWAGSEYWQIDNVQVSCSSPNAGVNASTSICSSAAPISLFNELGGSPDTGGTWSGPSNLTGGDQGVFDPSTMIAGIYTYSTGTAPCAATATVDVSFSSGAPINAGSDVAICDGNSTTISASGGASYVWDNGLGAGATQSVSPAATTTYTVTGTDANGCTGTDQVTVTVNQNPTPTISGIASYCAGSSAALSTVNAYTSYSWSTGDNSSTTNATTANNPITVTVTDAAGCTGASAGINVVETVAIIHDSLVEICQGETILIHGNTESVAGTYSQTFLLPSGCDSTSNVTLNVEALPTPSFSGDILTGCPPLDVNFMNTTAGSFTSGTWILGNGDIVSNLNSASTSYNQSGSYDVTLRLVSASGCVIEETYTDYIFVENTPTASFAPSSTTLNGDNPLIHFNNTSIGATNYQWDLGDGTQTDVENPSHYFDVSNESSYEVELVAFSSLGCTDTARIQLTSSDELIYYIPNSFTPDGDEFNQTFQPVFTEGFDPYDYSLLIFNRWGEVIFESHDVTIGWDGTYPGSNTPIAGVFTWKVEFKTLDTDERIIDLGHVNILR